MHIRRLEEAIFEGYRALRLRALKEEPSAFTSSWEEEVVKDDAYWRLRFQSAQISMFCGVEEGLVIGMSGVKFEERKKIRHKATIIAVYVAPEHRGLGIGKQLIHACLEEAFRHGHIEAVKLSVTGGNASAVSLYKGMGFEVWAEEAAALRVEGRYFSKVYMELSRTGYESNPL